MKFEESFPSLKGKGVIPRDVIKECPLIDCSHIHIKDIQKHCLDKQRVIDAIKKLAEEMFIGVDTDGDDRYTAMVKPERLLKELGI